MKYAFNYFDCEDSVPFSTLCAVIVVISARRIEDDKARWWEWGWHSKRKLSGVHVTQTWNQDTYHRSSLIGAEIHPTKHTVCLSAAHSNGTTTSPSMSIKIFPPLVLAEREWVQTCKSFLVISFTSHTLPCSRSLGIVFIALFCPV